MKKKLDLIISENASALPAHLEMGFGIAAAMEMLDIPIITHDHDFAWERGTRYVSPHSRINSMIQDVFPLRLDNSIHAVNNSNACITLEEKFGRPSVVVPNVMNFEMDFGILNQKNHSLRRDLGFQDTDKLLFQVTRIVRRKGIDVAIDLVHKFDDERIKLVITGDSRDDEGGYYYQELVNQIHEKKLLSQVFFASHLIQNRSFLTDVSNRKYSLSDAYAHATASTYFSTYEGFGNAFIESVLSKTPIFVNNYKPVYWPEIGSKGFKTVLLENNEICESSLAEMHEIIFNEPLNQEIGEYNFRLGKKYFSYDTLENKLRELIGLAMKKN
jgi:glycosyltransferase involved in cell wall biosynthesis